MFSYEERTKAINLLLQYDMRYTAVILEPGYPSKRALINWYEEYIENAIFIKILLRNLSSAMKNAKKLLTII